MRRKLVLLNRYLKGSRKELVFAFILAVLSTLGKLIIPFLAGRLINSLIAGEADHSLFAPYLIIMGVCLLVGMSARYGFDALCGKIAERTGEKIRNDIVDSYLNLPLSYLDKNDDGDLLLRLLNDTENVQNGLILGGGAFFDAIVAILVTFVMMFTLNWLLGLAVVVLTPLSLLTSRFVSKFNAKHFKGQAKNAGKMSGFVSESLNNSQTIENLNLFNERKEQFDQISKEYKNEIFRANMGASMINPSTRLVNNIINAILLTLGALVITAKINLSIDFGIGDLTAFMVYAANYMEPFNAVSDVVAEVSFAFASLERIDSLLNEKKEERAGLSIPKEINEISSKALDFEYVSGTPVLSNVNISLFKGKKIALVGPTGCGKTTLIQLLMKFYDPTSGDFFWDGLAGSKINRDAISEKVGMVLQDTWVFNGSVKDNIRYGRPDATDQEVIDAAKAALAHDPIMRLPNGYDTIISNGCGLSAGEKQLLCVARVFLKKPEIIVLDEATSNIDIRTEHLLRNSFDNLMEGKTSLVVAHRLSTIVHSDCIYYLNNGSIMEVGTHEELLKKRGYYYELYMSQFFHGDDKK